MKKFAAYILSIICVFSLAGCRNTDSLPVSVEPSKPIAAYIGDDVTEVKITHSLMGQFTVLDTLAPESELTITSSDMQVSDFLEKNQGFTTMYETDECYNITPDFVADHSDYSIFKYNKSCKSFILYDGEIYNVGTSFGGYGITSMALADLNKDGIYELYYTFSWGSGRHRSHVGYFEPTTKEIHVFDDEALFDSDMILTVNHSGDLCVNSAALDMDDSVNFTIKAQDFMGTLDFEEEQVVLNFT